MYKWKSDVEKILNLSADLFSVLVSIIIAYAIRYNNIVSIFRNDEQIMMTIVMLMCYVVVYMFSDTSNHRYERKFFAEMKAILKINVSFLVSWIVLLYLTHKSSELSRLVFTYFFVINIVLTYVVRNIIKQYMMKVYKNGNHSRRLLLITSTDVAEEVIDNIVSRNEWSRKLVGIVLADHNKVGQRIKGIPVVASYENCQKYVIRKDIDEVFFYCGRQVRIEKFEDFISELYTMGVDVDININTFDTINYSKKTLGRVGKYAVVTCSRNFFSKKQLFIKRVVDIVGSLVGMVILAVATIFVAPIIKLTSPGPVFFGQTRVGKNGHKFTFYKFRSMYQDAEQRKKELMDQNEVNGLMFKMTNDPRITPIGRFIRKTSIDELPQFWNILKGDMSLVGTRPPTVDEYEKYEAKHKCRLSMTPGLTGLWQISGRSDIKEFDEVVKLDMEYIDNWTIFKDIKILLKTVVIVLLGRGSR